MTRKKGAAKQRQRPAVTLAAESPLAAALARFRPLLSPDDFTALLAELERPLPQALRANPLKVDPQQALPGWEARYGWETRPVPFEPAGRQILAARTPVSQTIEHRLGFYYIQDAASMLPCALFDLDNLSRPLILDLAASPGGKTTHLIGRTGDQGLVLANDASDSRLGALRIVLQNWGAVNTAITHFPGEHFGAWFPDTFDRVLLDAPCSMQGLRSTESHPMRPITDNERHGLALRQARLLESALRAARTGGQVVYSTCTLSPDEDEGVLDALLRRYPGAFRVEDVSMRLPAPAPGLSGDGVTSYTPEVINAVRLWPHRMGTSGFFAALLTKQAGLGRSSEIERAYPTASHGLSPVNPRTEAKLASCLADGYGFDLRALLEGQDAHLAARQTRGGTALYFLVPAAFEAKFPGLPAHTAGLLLGEDGPDGFTPSHEWAARFAKDCQTGFINLPDDLVEAWISGADLPGLGSMDHAGQAVLVRDSSGRYLGRGRLQRDRLKNLLPRRIL